MMAVGLEIAKFLRKSDNLPLIPGIASFFLSSCRKTGLGAGTKFV